MHLEKDWVQHKTFYLKVALALLSLLEGFEW